MVNIYSSFNSLKTNMLSLYSNLLIGNRQERNAVWLPEIYARGLLRLYRW